MSLALFQTVASRAGLLEKMGKPGHFTLFAPTNEAFHHLEEVVVDRLMGNKGSLQGKLVIHVFYILGSIFSNKAWRAKDKMLSLHLDFSLCKM